MSYIDEMVKMELSELKSDLKKGDETVSEVSPSGKEVRHSKKAGEARVKFLSLVQSLLKSSSITAQEATKATNDFGKKTTTLYWVK